MSDDAKQLTHLDAEGNPRMVDVTAKAPARRTAVAEGYIRMSAEALETIRSGGTSKGDALQVARLAAIMAGKRTGELIPLCHVLSGTSVTVDVEPVDDLPGVRITAEARIVGQTGVEMEALTAVTVGLLTVYDMIKSVDRGMVMERIRLLGKEGGRSGSWRSDDSP